MQDQTGSDSQRIYAVCPGCTLMAVQLAYQRCPWFRLFRGPLWLGMCVLSWWHGFSPQDYLVRNQACYGCLRFRKNLLSERSWLFNFLNRFISPPFGRMLNRLAEDLTKEDRTRFAQQCTYRSLEEALADLQRELETGRSTRYQREPEYAPGAPVPPTGLRTGSCDTPEATDPPPAG